MRKWIKRQNCQFICSICVFQFLYAIFLFLSPNDVSLLLRFLCGAFLAATGAPLIPVGTEAGAHRRRYDLDHTEVIQRAAVLVPEH